MTLNKRLTESCQACMFLQVGAVVRTQKIYLSKSKGVIDKVARVLKDAGSITKVQDLFSMPYNVSRIKFGECFLMLVKNVYKVDDEIALDNMRIGELKYNTLYDNWKKFTTKKELGGK